VAVVGSGPAGFYTAEALLKSKQITAEVDLFERLPAPYGLVRYGVAPDHQKIKSVTAAYDKLCENPRMRFLGNVHVGHDISVEELVLHYDQVVFAVGCETDRRLGIAGEDLHGSHPATSFVAWYNGHPDFVDYPVSLDCERATIIGVGDVAMDLTRMLLQDPDRLAKTDIADHALAVFRRSRVREVVLLARRGPAQAAFATKELEDIVELPGIEVVIDHAQVRADVESGEEHDGLTKRKLEYLATLSTRPQSTGDRRAIFRFLTSPVEIVGDGTKVTGLSIARLPLRRLPWCSDSGAALRRAAGHRAERGRSRAAERGTVAVRLRFGMDQARSLRRHRNEQERRRGHGSEDAGGRSRSHGAAEAARGRRRAARVAERSHRQLEGLAPPRRHRARARSGHRKGPREADQRLRGRRGPPLSQASEGRKASGAARS
jgi:NADPH-dependent glutamate synthase beta subunit-like oxidoreductase